MIDCNAINAKNIFHHYSGDTFDEPSSGVDNMDNPCSSARRGINYAYQALKEATKSLFIEPREQSTFSLNFDLGFDATRERRTDKFVIDLKSDGAWSESAWNVYSPVTNDTSADIRDILSSFTTKMLVDSLHRAVSAGWARDIQVRLSELYEASFEEAPEQEPLAPESLRGFIKFINCTPGLKFPSVVLTPNGLVRAKWKRSNRELLSITFINHNDLKHMVFSPNRKHKNKTLMVSGLSTADMLGDIMKPYNIADLYLDIEIEALGE